MIFFFNTLHLSWSIKITYNVTTYCMATKLLIHNLFACSLQQRVASFYAEFNDIFWFFLHLHTIKLNYVKHKSKNTADEQSRLFKLSQENWFHQIFGGKSSTFLLLLLFLLLHSFLISRGTEGTTIRADSERYTVSIKNY